MRMLPDTPSVDFLRREAKDLLAALREQAPSATLADAQQALARQYGTASWTDLRAEVDRRRARPPEPDAELMAELAGTFALGRSAFAGAVVPAWELGYVLVQWAVYGGVNPRAARALLDGYRSVAGEVPSLALGSFAFGIGGYLSWTYNMFCEAIVAEGGEKTQYAELSVREVVDDPLTVEKLETLLAALTATPA